MARPRKNVTALQGDYTKEVMKERVALEKAITGDADDIRPPIFIKYDEIALEEFWRLVGELQKVNLVTNVDTNLLGVYALNFSQYVETVMTMRNEPMVTEHTNKGGATNAVVNPLLKIQQQCESTLMKISEKYGLDPASRSKIAHLSPSDKEEEVDPLMLAFKQLKEG